MGVALLPHTGNLAARLARISQRIPVPMDPAMAALRKDRVAFTQAAGIAPDVWQADVLRSDSPRILLNCSRQSGKSTVVGALALHKAIYEPGALVVVVAVAQRQATEMIRACRDLYAALDRPIAAESENKLSLELRNGSRILSVPSTEATIRGLSKARLLILDEASRIPDALYAAVLPFLAISNGALALLSTPFGKRGFFYNAYCHRDEWFYREVWGQECPRISAEFLAKMRREMGDYFYAQEWECQFNDSVTGAFRSADIDAAVKDYPVWDLGQYSVPADVGFPQEEEDGARWNLAQYATR